MDPQEKADRCDRPEIKRGHGGKCPPEQIRLCHGAVENHPCETESTEEKRP